MRLRKFEIRNFKNLRDIAFVWDNIVVLIGDNNTGKSSILEAIEWFLGGNRISDRTLFRDKRCEWGDAIELVGHFADLTEYERTAPGAVGNMFGEEWIVRKKYWMEQVDGEMKFQEEYACYKEVIEYVDWPEQSRSWTYFPESYRPFVDRVKEEYGNRVGAESIRALKDIVGREAPGLIRRTTEWVANPGGGGGWKSNVNHLLPRIIPIRAVHDAQDEIRSKDQTTYGKIVGLIVERQLLQKPEFLQLAESIKRVQALFTGDADHPEWTKAPEVVELEHRITERLSRTISATAKIEMTAIDLSKVINPTAELFIDDGIDLPVARQGHGLQRSLIVSLLQVLLDYDNQPQQVVRSEGEPPLFHTKAVIFAIEEPELYMHPQMERKMRDIVYGLAATDSYQVVCCTHSPVFIDFSRSHNELLRLTKNEERVVSLVQAEENIFAGDDLREVRQRLRFLNEFDPTVNELFFASRVTLVEGNTEIYAFRRCAELTELFEQYPRAKHGVALVNCHSKGEMKLFIRVLEHFGTPYLAVIDSDVGNIAAERDTEAIRELIRNHGQLRLLDPDIEGLLGYRGGRDKPFEAYQKVEELHRGNALPAPFIEHTRAVFHIT